MDAYSTVLSETLERLATLKTLVITIESEAKWINDDIKRAEAQTRQAEFHKETYVGIRNSLDIIISSSK